MDPSELQAVIKLSRIGLDLLASRMLSYTCLLGLLGLAFYVAWRPDWYGVAVVAIIAVAVYIPALRAESLRRFEMRKGPDNA
jgi:ABC-type siderophore export system fused ATPase/permease subunit